MKPPPFEYAAPRSLDEALSLLAEHGEEAKVLAGGQSLIPVLNFRLTRPSMLIDINDLAELAAITPLNGRGLRIGAMARQRAAERSADLASRAPLVAQALPFVAHPQIRNRGTIGGSLAHADPAAELPAVMLALEATFELRSRSAQRTLTADAFYTGLFSTALAPDELLVACEVHAAPAGVQWGFDEVARRHGDFALMAVAAGVGLDASGRIAFARLAYVNAGAGPVRARAVEQILAGNAPSTALWTAAADALNHEIDPPSDVHASSDYRRHLAGVLTRRLLARLTA
jgi:aerobic carbon-monoxide dehydrogenase medium subunit